jgi:FkbM family methyltransferase
MSLVLDLQEEKDYWLGTYEPELQSAIADLAKPGMVAYDVGANIGYISLLLARAVGESGRVVAFEALPENINRLRENLALNRLEARVEVVPAAVMDHNGQVEFLIGPSGGMGKALGSAGRDSQYNQSIPVEGLSLDDYVFRQGNSPPQLVKIDIEGGEVMAIPGMRRLLMEAHPILLMELHGPEAARAAWEALSAAGYRLSRMSPGYSPLPSIDKLEWKAYILAK